MRTWALVLCFTLGSAQARADDAEARARALFEAGLAHARAGHWEGARHAFEESHRLSPDHLSALFNLAGAQLRTGELLHAHANYHRLRAQHGAALSSSHRRAIARQLGRIEELMPRLRLQIEGLRPDDRVLLDKTRLYPNELELELWVDPGRHVLAIYRPGGAQVIREIVLIKGQHQFISLAAP